MAKTFTHVGVATYKGKTKFRFTNGRAEARVKTMTKEGFENIEFIALESVMTKAEALKTAQAADISARYGIPIPAEAEVQAEQPLAEAA